MKTLILTIGLLGLASVVGCATSGSLKTIDIKEPITLRLQGKPGQTDLTEYHSHTQILASESGQPVKEKDEVVDFVVEEKVEKVEANGELLISASTIKKDGSVPLHDMAFPELGEKITYLFSPEGKVLRAGEFPRQSIYYIPPVPLPPEPVSPGDTWDMSHSWISLNTGLPMVIHVVAIFKRVVECGPYGGRCVDLELSGASEVLGAAPMPGSGFASEFWGRMLFSLDRGSVIWSEMRNREKMTAPQGQVDVLSCMSSTLLGPSTSAKAWRPDGQKSTTCTPQLGPVRI